MFVRTVSTSHSRRFSVATCYHTNESKNNNKPRRFSETVHPKIHPTLLVIGNTNAVCEQQKVKKTDNKRITIMVCGKIYETFEQTINTFPDTLLGNPLLRKKYFDRKLKRYVFKEQCVFSFDAILFYYQSKGILSKPSNVKRDVFISQLNFFGIKRYLDERQEEEIKYMKKITKHQSPPQSDFQKLIWSILEMNHAKTLASWFWYVLNMMLLLLSMSLFCLQTFPTYLNNTYVMYFQLVFCLLFGLELLTRLAVVENKKDYVYSLMFLMDLAATLPFLILLPSRLELCHYPDEIIRFISFTSVFQVFKITRFSRGLQLVLYTLRECSTNVILLFSSALITSIGAAAILFNAENLDGKDRSHFHSMPDSMWFSIITTTGVGYGDIVPITAIGKIVSGCLAVLGILMFCLPTTMLVTKFVECYYLPEVLSENIDEERRRAITDMRNSYLQQFEP